MNIIDLLKDVPTIPVLKERLSLAQEKLDFEITKANQGTQAAELRAQTAEARAKELEAHLANEKKEHAITRQKLNDALEFIKRSSGQSKTVTQADFNRRIPKFTAGI